VCFVFVYIIVMGAKNNSQRNLPYTYSLFFSIYFF
jgi:hypothetical protein